MKPSCVGRFRADPDEQEPYPPTAVLRGRWNKGRSGCKMAKLRDFCRRASRISCSQGPRRSFRSNLDYLACAALFKHESLAVCTEFFAFRSKLQMQLYDPVNSVKTAKND